MNYKIPILTLIFLVPECLSSRPCCEGENVIVQRRCLDGAPMTSLTCPHKYMLNKDPTTTIDQNDNLLVHTSRISPHEYCATRYNNSDYFIVCFSDTSLTGYNKMYVVNAILELVSVFFLIVTILVYLQVTDLLDLQGISILHSITGLTVSFVVLATNQLSTVTIEKNLCLTYAYVMYVSMLYAFFWLNVLSFHIWRTSVKPKFLRSSWNWAYIYHLFGIGGPMGLLIMLIVASSMEYSEMHPGFSETKCWFKTTKSQFVYFYAPLALLLCVNIVYYGWTLTILWRDLTKCDEKKAKVLKYKVVLCVKLFFIMGISWIFELLSAAFADINPTLDTIWHITDCLNTLQGVFIFVILVVLRKRVIRGLANRSFFGLRLPSGWRNLQDDECEEIEEEFNLSETQAQKI